MKFRTALLALGFLACGPAQTSALNTQPGCPATWADAQSLCNTPGCTGNTSCVYPHMGDQLGPNRSDWADAVLGCFDPGSDAGTGVWRCAQ
jgi:hypothetical protein